MDNLTMRSHRRAVLLLEFHSSNGVTPIESFIEESRKMLETQKPAIETYSVYLTDIQKNAFVVQVEFFSPAIEIGAFNKLREQVSLDLLKMIEVRQLRLIQKEPGEVGG
jgi:MscS family membrane protein